MRRALALLAAASLWSSVFLLTTPAGADAPEATGWWARWTAATPATPHTVTAPGVGQQVSVPQPPSQPEQTRLVPPGGLYVAAEPTSETQPPPAPLVGVQAPGAPYRPTGVSAVRMTVDDTMALGELVLEIDVHPGGQRKVQGTPAIRACPAQYVWTPEEGGPIESAPPADCASGLSFGVFAETEVRIPVGGLVRDGMLNIVLEPLPTSAFQVVFKKPSDQSIAVTRFPKGDDVPPGFEAYVGFDSGPAFEATTGTSGAFAFGDFSLPAPLATLTPPSPPAAGPSRAVPASSLPAARRLPLASRTPRLMAAMVLVGLMLIYLGLLQQPGRLPRLLGPFASVLPNRRDRDLAPAVPPSEWPQGIGRFARVRTGPPPKL